MPREARGVVAQPAPPALWVRVVRANARVPPSRACAVVRHLAVGTRVVSSWHGARVEPFAFCGWAFQSWAWAALLLVLRREHFQSPWSPAGSPVLAGKAHRPKHRMGGSAGERGRLPLAALRL